MKKSSQQPIIPICKFEKNNLDDDHILECHRLPDVGEEATIHHEGQDILISVNMLNDIRKLGFGNYGSVMLVEVENHPDIKMAVKVPLLSPIRSIDHLFFNSD